MRVALVGPREMTEFDKKEVENYIKAIADDCEIVFLAYRSIETEIFKYFVSNEHLAHKLTIYTFQDKENLPKKLQTPIDYLISHGTKYLSFGRNEVLIKRSTYVDTWREILETCDSVVSFYDGKKTSLLIPVDEAKRQRKKAFIYSLPGLDEKKFELTPDKKIRSVL